MASFVGHDLLDSDHSSGGAFIATRPLTKDFDRRGRDVSVHGRARSKWILVKLARQVPPAELLTTALTEANVALDLVGRHGPFLELDAPSSDHLLWWRNPSGQARLRAVHLTFFAAPRFHATGRAVRADGTEAPPEGPPPWHPSLRFYRRAHLTDDPIERFRHIYLAIENLLSEVCPKPSNEGEPAWLQRGLLQQGIDCSAVLPSAALTTDAVEHVVTLIYKQARLPAFHAKHGRYLLLPADTKALTDAAMACEVALRLLRAIAASVGQRLGGSFVHQHGFEMMTQRFAEGARIQFSADTRVFDPDDAAFSDPAHPVTELVPTTTTARFARFMQATLTAPTTPLARVGLVADGAAVSASCYETVLDPVGFAEMEFVLGLQMTQPGIAWATLPPITT